MKKLLIGFTLLASMSSFANEVKKTPQVDVDGDLVYLSCDYDPIEACRKIDSKFRYGKDVECRKITPSFLAEAGSFGKSLFAGISNGASNIINSISLKTIGSPVTGYINYCSNNRLFRKDGTQCQEGGEKRLGSKLVSVLHLNENREEWVRSKRLQPGLGHSVEVISSISCEQ